MRIENKSRDRIILLGDSILDNGAYVGPGLSVLDHLRKLVPDGTDVHLAAVDGSVVSDVAGQVGVLPENRPPGRFDCVVSTGGNDVLGYLDLLNYEVSSSMEVFSLAASLRGGFANLYRRMFKAVQALQPDSIKVCTVYDCVPGFPQSAFAVLSMFNEVILRVASENGAGVVDLRVVCQEVSDYAEVSPIEPSASGGLKIAKTIISELGKEIS